MSTPVDMGPWGRYRTTLNGSQLLFGKRSCRGTEFHLGKDKAEMLNTINELLYSLDRVRTELQRN